MSAPVLSVEGLSKSYKLGAIGRHTLVDEFQHLYCKLRGKDPKHVLGKVDVVSLPKQSNKEFWALKDVNFEVQTGEVLGVIGGNGAGKSTLLKILSRVTEPTSGQAVIRGRVGSLLEVGTGFHPELTGRENVYMNGTILGMKKREVAAKFDEIVAFSGIEKFIDTPVKRYSSGMYVRLAFAVAAHLEPEILIVDEVLAVGDADFQKKCLGKMGDVAKAGRTVLFVSHQMSAVSQLCDRTLFMKNGRIHATGPTESMIELYLAAGSEHTKGSYHCPPEKQVEKQPCILSVETVNNQLENRIDFNVKESVSLKVGLLMKGLPNGAVLDVSLKDHYDRRLFTASRPCSEMKQLNDIGSNLLKLPTGLLTPGHYRFIVALHIPGMKIIDCVDPVCQFSIVETGSEFAHYTGDDYGVFFVKCDWEDL